MGMGMGIGIAVGVGMGGILLPSYLGGEPRWTMPPHMLVGSWLPLWVCEARVVRRLRDRWVKQPYYLALSQTCRYVTAGLDALLMLGNGRVVLMLDWPGCRSSHSEAWTLSKHSRAIG